MEKEKYRGWEEVGELKSTAGERSGKDDYSVRSWATDGEQLGNEVDQTAVGVVKGARPATVTVQDTETHSVMEVDTPSHTF